MMCRHFPPCPLPMASDAAAARVISSHQEQGWSLLCNGTVLFDDGGLLRPDGASVGPAFTPIVIESRRTAVPAQRTPAAPRGRSCYAPGIIR
jgi:hypothetical protein